METVARIRIDVDADGVSCGKCFFRANNFCPFMPPFTPDGDSKEVDEWVNLRKRFEECIDSADEDDLDTRGFKGAGR